MTLDEFFAGQDLSRQLFDKIAALVNAMASVEIRVTKSQVCFRRRKAFAWVWMPGMYLNRQVAPLVLTFVFHHKDPSPRWKEIVQPSPGHFTHHLELYSLEEIDDEVAGWLRYACENSAGI